MATWIIVVLAFFGAFLAIIAANAVLLELASGERRRLHEELQLQLRQRLKKRIQYVDPGDPETGGRQSGRSLIIALNRLIEQSGLTVTLRQVTLIALSLAMLAGTACWVFTLSFQLAIPAAVVASLAPLLYLLRARHQRLEKLRSQLPDTFETMSRVLRAGQTISQAMQIVAEAGTPPISLEFYRCSEQMNLGMTPDAALLDLAQRTGLLEIKIFTVAVLVQRQTGGNLSELFDKMGGVVRERFRIRGMINGLTAQGRLQAVILSALPVVVFILLSIIAPDYERQLFDHPLMVLSAVGLIAVGSVWIRRVVDFDY